MILPLRIAESSYLGLMAAQCDTAHHHVFICSVAEHKLSEMADHIDSLEREGYRVVAMTNVGPDDICVAMFRP